MKKLADIDEADWSLRQLTSGIWTIFPHVSIARFDVIEDVPMFMVSVLYPGDSPDTSITVQHFLTHAEMTDEVVEAMDTQQAFLLHVVRDEDYFTGKRIQQAAKTGAKSQFLFGRNELGGQRFHGWVDRLVAAESGDDFDNVMATAEVAFQR